MVWVKGKSGNPAGRPPDNLCVTNQLKKILGRTPQAKSFARSMVSHARAGDASMVREVLDRTEGKVIQRIEQDTNLVVKRYEDMTSDEARAALAVMLDALSVTEGIPAPRLPGVVDCDTDHNVMPGVIDVVVSNMPSSCTTGSPDNVLHDKDSIPDQLSPNSAGGPIIVEVERGSQVISSSPAGSADFPGGRDASDLPTGFAAGPADTLSQNVDRVSIPAAVAAPRSQGGDR